MKPTLYPKAPANVPVQVTSPSPAFKREVFRVIAAIFLFLFVYLLLVLLAGALAIGCCYAGCIVITSMLSFFGIVIGGGLILLGLGMIYFLVKFLFAVNRDMNENRIAITEEEEPTLFAFIRELTTETHTPFPGKIFISPDANAGVFYDSNFRSLFFPDRKNLEIGIGLVNSLNISEFKAVMAHEFGHFSQDSMRLGSYTYHVNRIIYNMLYENTGYNKFLSAWGRLHWVLSLFARLTALFATAIQWILRQMFIVVNKSFLRLSRQMEFHADAISASVSGSNNLETALRRIRVTQSCYQIVLNLAGEGVKNQQMSGNLYRDHSEVLGAYDAKTSPGSRVNYKDQWASHPTLEERTDHLEGLALPVEAMSEPSWTLFRDPEATQEKVTRHLYREVKFKGDPLISRGVIAEEYRESVERRHLPKVYGAFYENRIVDVRDWDIPELMKNAAGTELPLDRFDLPSKIRTVELDLEMIRAIADKKIDASSFDFAGMKYSRGQATRIVERLASEEQALGETLKSADQQVFRHFVGLADPVKAAAIRERYIAQRQLQLEEAEFAKASRRVVEQIAPVFKPGATFTFQQINALVETLIDSMEPPLKRSLEKLQRHLHQPILGKVRVYLSKEYTYFKGKKFQSAEVIELYEICLGVAGALKEEEWERQKEALIFQL